MNCRFCNNHLTHEFIDLVNAPPSNAFLTKEQLSEPEVFYPLKLFVCDSCFLVQIDEYKKSSDIFNSGYVYFSSFSRTWLVHAKQYADMMIEKYGYDQNSRIIEIASNDGYLLQYFIERGISSLGIEPAEGTAVEARKKGIETIVDFFSKRLAQNLADQGKKADLLIGNNVLAHVPDLHDFVAGLKIALKPSGIITMEFPHLMQLVDNCQFDTIYHEHFSYLSFMTVRSIFNHHGLELFDVEELPTHGGSLRIFARHAEDQTRKISDNVNALLEKEMSRGLNAMAYYRGFQEKADQIKCDLLNFLIEQRKSSKKVVAYGAAAKGNTLLNYCGVRKDLLAFVVDASPYKQGKYLPGSHIQVVSEEAIRRYEPDYVLILPWNIREEIMAQLDYIRAWGGKFVVPIPYIQVI
ncbi:MAG: methyltransferase domain-containing protein [Methanosarcinales archaeon]|nr:MAG: methyltransferase domain-containing protein [Methanosarcinales archaeon]